MAVPTEQQENRVQAGGLLLPPPGRYEVDVAHSNVSFVARHLVGSKVRGTFSDFEGVVDITEKPGDSKVTASVQVASVQTGVDARDEHLRTSDFLEVAAFPTMELRTVGLTHRGGDEWTLAAELTVHGITRTIDFALEYLGSGPGMQEGTQVVAFSAAADVDRRDFGVSFSGALDNGGLIVGHKVRIEIDVEAIKTQ